MTATTIRLYGQMGAKFGRVHRAHLDTRTVGEAISYLCSQFPEARKYLINSKDDGVGFAVFRGQKNLSQDELSQPVGDDEIRIAPVLIGSKNGGVFQIVLGIVLIVVGYFCFGATTTQGAALIAAGIGSTIGGVVQLLSPQPKGLKNGDGPNNDPSYSFAGPVNTEAQGHPVPIVYGRGIVGSAVVSAGIVAEDYVQHGGVGAGTPNFNPKTPFEIPE